MTKATTTPSPSIEEASIISEKSFASSSTNNTMPKPNSTSNSSNNASTSSIVSHPHQQYVDHTYTDYANVDEDDLRMMKGTAGGSGSDAAKATPTKWLGRSCHGGSSVMPFPGKLLEVLDRGDLTSIVDWMPHGRAFIVKQPKVFTTHVLPRFFKQTKFLSFTRQLNLWGFKRITRGLDAGAYYHELFLPGRPNLVLRMKRQKIKGTGIRPIPNPEREPNFYYQYKHVARVPQSSVPIPLPPLPSERIASLMGGGDPSRGVVLPQAVLSQGMGAYHAPQPLPRDASLGRTSGTSPTMSLGLGDGVGTSSKNLGQSMEAINAAAVAKFRLYGSLNSGLNSSSSLGSLSSNKTHPISRGESASSSQMNYDYAASKLYMHQQASMPAPASSFQQHMNLMTNNVHDEVSNANRRLMERLMDQTSASAILPESLARRSSPEEAAIRRASLYAESMSSSAASLSSVRRESFNRMSPPAAPNATFGNRDFSGYGVLPSHHHLEVPSHRHQGSRPTNRSSMPPLSSSTMMSSRNQDVNVNTVTNALREAQHLEELARGQRATARALAGVLQQCAGYDAKDLLPLTSMLNPE
ncbi:hypothetical protein ACHAXR_009009 [Thalassiosira sp. AJA248-18]